MKRRAPYLTVVPNDIRARTRAGQFDHDPPHRPRTVRSLSRYTDRERALHQIDRIANFDRRPLPGLLALPLDRLGASGITEHDVDRLRLRKARIETAAIRADRHEGPNPLNCGARRYAYIRYMIDAPLTTDGRTPDGRRDGTGRSWLMPCMGPHRAHGNCYSY